MWTITKPLWLNPFRHLEFNLAAGGDTGCPYVNLQISAVSPRHYFHLITNHWNLESKPFFNLNFESSKYFKKDLIPAIIGPSHFLNLSFQLLRITYGFEKQICILPKQNKDWKKFLKTLISSIWPQTAAPPYPGHFIKWKNMGLRVKIWVLMLALPQTTLCPQSSWLYFSGSQLLLWSNTGKLGFMMLSRFNFYSSLGPSGNFQLQPHL